MAASFGRMISAFLAAAILCVLSGPALAEPGPMIRATAMAGTPTGARAWRIRYETTNLNGRRAEATGVLVAPDGPAPAGGRDVVAWAHGAVGIAANCTPIRTLDQIPGLNDMIARG